MTDSAAFDWIVRIEGGPNFAFDNEPAAIKAYQIAINELGHIATIVGPNGVVDTAALANVSRVRIGLALRAFGDALSCRVSMGTRLGDVPPEVMHEAMAEALASASPVPPVDPRSQVWATALRVWQSEQRAREFMERPHMLLDGQPPYIAALQDVEHAETVLQILGRLEYGATP